MPKKSFISTCSYNLPDDHVPVMFLLVKSHFGVVLSGNHVNFLSKLVTYLIVEY